MKTVDTFTARIYVGAYDTENGFERPLMEARSVCQDFVESEALCVNVRKTFFQYGSPDGISGSENGVVVELINYPRFPSEPEEITDTALDLAEKLMEVMNQKRVSVVCSDKTYMLENDVNGET